jgi:hypothetical protein
MTHGIETRLRIDHAAVGDDQIEVPDRLGSAGRNDGQSDGKGKPLH